MNNKKLILHIGMPKTGTTTIQQTLYESRDMLLKNGISYPDCGTPFHNDTFAPIFSNSTYTIPYYMHRGFTEENHVEKRNELLELWENILTSNLKETTIISTELPVNLLEENEIYDLHEFLKKYFDEIRLVIYLRYPQEFMISMLQEYTKTGLIDVNNKYIASNDFNANIKEILDMFKNEQIIRFYRNAIKWVEKFSDNAVVRVFDKKHFYKNDLFKDFAVAAGIDANVVKNLKVVNSNESIGEKSVAFLDLLNQKYPQIVDGKLNSTRGLNNNMGIPMHIFKNLEDKKFSLEVFLNRDQADVLNYYIDYFNEMFEETYNEMVWDKIVPSTKIEKFFPVEDIDVEYFVDLFNEYNKHLEVLYKERQWFISDTEAKNQYISDLIKGKEWLDEQLKHRDNRALELEEYIKNLLKDKEWYLQQVENRQSRIDELESYLEIIKDKNKQSEASVEAVNLVKDLEFRNKELEAKVKALEGLRNELENKSNNLEELIKQHNNKKIRLNKIKL